MWIKIFNKHDCQQLPGEIFSRRDTPSVIFFNISTAPTSSNSFLQEIKKMKRESNGALFPLTYRFPGIRMLFVNLIIIMETGGFRFENRRKYG